VAVMRVEPIALHSRQSVSVALLEWQVVQYNGMDRSLHQMGKPRLWEALEVELHEDYQVKLAVVETAAVVARPERLSGSGVETMELAARVEIAHR
jgi:hypothetical protein